MKLLRYASAICAIAFMAGTAQAACRVTDYSAVPLGSLSEFQQLSFVSQMTRTEFDRLKSLRQGAPDYLPFLSDKASVPEARRAAIRKLDATNIENIGGYRAIWATDYLGDSKLRSWLECNSRRSPGLRAAGRRHDAHTFNLSYVHLTPIGIEKIKTRLLASQNVANARAFAASLDELGMQDNYEARTFSLKLENPDEPAVVVMRAGWETPLFIYVPPMNLGTKAEARAQ